MLRFSKVITALAVTPILVFATPVLAANEGQTEGGDIYRIKNITKNVDFTDPASADSCNVLEYKVRVHNPGPGMLSNVNVKATLPSDIATSNTSTVTVSSQNADPSSTSDNAVVNLSSAQSLSYVNGTTQLLNANDTLIKNLPDGITTGGVDIGDVGVSINNKEFVQFQAKVNCPTPPVTPPVTPTPPVVTPQVLSKTTTLPNTGPGEDVAGVFAGATALGAAGHYIVAIRRNRRGQ